MPGIITHNKIFREAINFLSKRRRKSYLLRSIGSLFSSEGFLKAGLFGSIGPNIFDYIPKRDIKNYYGNEISFFLHNGGSGNLISSMVKKINSFKDKNTEWSAFQRAYLYGFISHIISDSIFHPFVFYWSGFPSSDNIKEKYFYREQNLLFEYNMDNYYLYMDENSSEIDYDINSMLPVKKIQGILRLNPAIKNLILESFFEAYPDIYKKIIWRDDKDKDKKLSVNIGYIDLIPYLIRVAYWLKRNRNRYFLKLVKKRKNRLFSDFLVKYPEPRRVNSHVLNFHQERWQYPVQESGFHYESVKNLLQISSEKIVEAWEEIECSQYGKDVTDTITGLDINAYTGVSTAGYFDMKIKNPVRLRF